MSSVGHPQPNSQAACVAVARTGSVEAVGRFLSLRAEVVFVLALLLALSACAWRQPVTSAPQNRNDAAFYLVLASNILDHGVYSHQQTAPFTPHTEWPPGVPLWYSVPVAVARMVPSLGLTLCIRLWTWGTALVACLLVYRYLRRFCTSGISTAIVAATAFNTAFLDEAQVALADIPALAALFGVLLWIEKLFMESRQSRAQHAGLLLCMSCLPLVKPYLGVVFVAYLWKAAAECRALSTTVVGPVHVQLRRVVRPALLHIGVLAACCIPFATFMVWSVKAADEAGTISAVTWLTTDNAVAQREGIAVADPKTSGEWIQNAADTVKYHLVYHIASSPLPLLQSWGLRDWAAGLRWLVTVPLLCLLITGMVRNIRGDGGAAVVFLVAMLAVFSVLACDSIRYFIILLPLCAWMIVDGIRITAESILAMIGTNRRMMFEQRFGLAMLSLAVCAGTIWGLQRRSDVRDVDPFFDAVYRELAEVRRRTDQDPLCVPYPLREIAIMETGRRVMTHQEWLALPEADQARCVVLVTSPGTWHNAALSTSQKVVQRLVESGVVVDTSRDEMAKLVNRDALIRVEL